MMVVIDQGNQCYKLATVVTVGWIRVDAKRQGQWGNAALTNVHQSSCQPSTAIPSIISLVGSKVTHHHPGFH